MKKNQTNAAESRVPSSALFGDGGPATPTAPEREWAYNRCMYSWNGNGGWCPSCGDSATHGRVFANTKEVPNG